jgi:hypothetical protein
MDLMMVIMDSKQVNVFGRPMWRERAEREVGGEVWWMDELQGALG